MAKQNLCLIIFSIAGFSFLFAVMDPVDNSIKYVFHAFGVADLIFQTVFAVYTFSSFDCVSYQQPTFFVKSVSERERERTERAGGRGRRETSFITVSPQSFNSSHTGLIGGHLQALMWAGP